jgi:hypothetical protein
MLVRLSPTAYLLRYLNPNMRPRCCFRWRSEGLTDYPNQRHNLHRGGVGTQICISLSSAQFSATTDGGREHWPPTNLASRGRAPSGPPLDRRWTSSGELRTRALHREGDLRQRVRERPRGRPGVPRACSDGSREIRSSSAFARGGATPHGGSRARPRWPSGAGRWCRTPCTRWPQPWRGGWSTHAGRDWWGRWNLPAMQLRARGLFSFPVGGIKF